MVIDTGSELMLLDSDVGLFVLGNFLSMTCAEVFLRLCLAECLRSLLRSRQLGGFFCRFLFYFSGFSCSGGGETLLTFLPKWGPPPLVS